MAKKIMAAMLALVMCAGLAACGDKKEDKDSSSKASDSAKADDQTTSDKQTTSDETTTDEGKTDNSTTDDDKSKDGDDDSSAAEVLVNDDTTFQTSDVTLKLINNNIIYIDENNLETRPTDEEVQATLDAILKQYKAAEDKDTQAFLDTFNFGILNEPVAELCDLLFEYDNDHSNEEFQQKLTDTNQNTKYAVVDDIIGMLEQLGDADVNDQLNDAMEAKDSAKLRELITKLTDSVKPDAEAVKTNLNDATIFNSEEDIQKMDIGDDVTYGFFLEYCGKYEDQLYMRLTFSVLSGEKEYDLGGVETWSVGDDIGVYITSEAYELDMEDDMKGMDTKQIFEALKVQMTAPITE
ncbi:hypothetical protein [Ruminococcus albus]|uniref:Uncharacterized protein n=1 Tax=Ruminococcus albus TaxID=1264 RepID=A0A1I1HLE8_RUMAL|nr:hypothetical protein [Ruminococcus albus]SFC22788.1 hypothetical protein SAMN02910406_01356 [Ruminococcus albus]